MESTLTIIIYCLFIVVGSLFGGWLPSLIRLTHIRMQLMVSFVGGLMLGVGLFHLLPHSIHYTGDVDRSVWWMVIGILGIFFLIRVFHFHQHAAAETTDDHDHDTEHHGQHPYSWLGVAIGLALHTLIDGIALGAGVMAEPEATLPGLSIFLVVLLHKPLDALSITSLMAASGWSMQARQVVNVAFALMCPLGAMLFALFAIGVEGEQKGVIGCALAFSAGVFVCIALGDLLPEVHFHKHDRLKLSAALLLGILAAYAVFYLEDHSHHGPRHDMQERPHGNHVHDGHSTRRAGAMESLSTS